VLLGLQCEGIAVDTRVRVAGVVHVRLDLVEVLTGLFLEAILTVEDELEAGKRAARHVGDDSAVVCETILDPLRRADVGGTSASNGETAEELGRSTRRSDGAQSDDVGISVTDASGGLEHDSVGGQKVRSKVPETCVRGRAGVVSPHELLDGVVVGQADLLLLDGGGRNSDRIRTGVLNLLNQVLVTLLGKSATLLSVEVHVVTPDLDTTGAVVQSEFASQVKVKADLVVLESNKRQVQPRVPVEEEQEGKVNLVRSTGGTVGEGGSGVSGHLGVVVLLVRGQIQLRVQTPPDLVVFVDALTTDGELDVLDGALSTPDTRQVAAVTSMRYKESVRSELKEHITDKIAVTSNGDGQAAVVTGRPIHSLLDDLHRKVRMALVHSLEKSNLGVTSEIDILSTVSNKLH